MRAYILPTDFTIDPFGDRPGDCLIGNRALRDLQAGVLYSLGIPLQQVDSTSEVDDSDERLLVTDSLFFSTELIREFIQVSRKRGRSTVCALKRGLFTHHSLVTTQQVSVHPDRVEYGLRYEPGRGRSGEAEPVVIDPEGFSQAFPMPAHVLGGSELRIPLTTKAIVQVDHWANLWAANMALLLARLARLRVAPKPRLFTLVVRARSLNRWRLLTKSNCVGRGCDIHPTAYVEASNIGDNVMIGAGSVVRASIVGNGVSIGSNSTVECSVIGDGCAIDSNSATFCSVLYPGTATSTRQILASLCGRDTFVADGVFLADYRFDGRTVAVNVNGRMVDTGSVALGPCLGHGVYLGAGCVVPPGRAIPNGLRIVPKDTRSIVGPDSDGTIPGHRIIGKANEQPQEP